MHRALYLFAALLILAAPAFSADVIELDPAETGFRLEVNDRGAEVITASVSEIRIGAVEIDGQMWAVPQAPNGSNLMERGLPSLPFLSSDYLLDSTGGIQLVKTSEVVREIDLAGMGFAGVAPSKGHFDRTIDPDDVPWVFDDAVYGGDKLYPTVSVWVDDPFISGPLRGQAFRAPVARWDSETNVLTVAEQVSFEVVKLDNAPNARTSYERPMNALFAGRSNAVNADRHPTDDPIEPGRLLILAYDDFIDEAEPLAEWESLVGYPTMLQPLSSVPHSGSSPTAAEIKAHIQALYDEPEGLAWVILVGDHAEVPTLSGVFEGAKCDPCYTKLEGGDNRPDAAISRISAQNGDQVTVQVDKILHYEREPDTGAAAEWYDRAFGVASNDSGGSPSYHDWERMNFLRDVLVDPAYTYTEFDELYISPSKAEVKASIEAGKSLGFYIGHGAEYSWVTSGFSVSDVHQLVNGEMLPVVWDVACVNGAFHQGECFAESWLRREGGGAVSFEAATTNESWVPPCDAQRAFVDAIALETDFTTGAQHLAGKHVCMDINGDGGNDQGNRFMEQSHIFGSVVLWPRTVEPALVDEPTDFVVAGGVASITVMVGGVPVAKEGGAIVNFFREEGQQIVPLGAGLTDENGLAQAAVSGDPTHCHIHGHNLVPQSFELAAQDDGRVNLDGAVYACASVVGIRVADANVPGATPSVADAVTVRLDNGTDHIDVVLTETDLESGFFAGSVTLGVDLTVADGDVLTATYTDEDTGAGVVDKTSNATVDCAAPVISAVDAAADHESVTIMFTTDEPGTTVVRWGLEQPPTNLIVNDALVAGEHSVRIDSLDPCEEIYFEVESADGLGNSGGDDNGGLYYSVVTHGWTVYFEETLDSDPGWDIDNGSFNSASGWAFGQPTGQAQDSYGGPDPVSGNTGDNVYGINLDGDAPSGVGVDELTLTMPSVDLSAAGSVQLAFWRWLGVESDSYDHARVQVSADGGPWTLVWENGSSTIDESSWTEHVYDITDLAAGHADVRIRWTYGSSDGSWQYCGWNIDDIRIEGSSPCTVSPGLFGDDFESGDCELWSGVIGMAP